MLGQAAQYVVVDRLVVDAGLLLEDDVRGLNDTLAPVDVNNVDVAALESNELAGLAAGGHLVASGDTLKVDGNPPPEGPPRSDV